MAAVATVDDVRSQDLLNELKNVPDGFIQCVLDTEAACLIGPLWAEAGMEVIGESLVAAHIVSLQLKGSNGPAGPVTAEAAGGLSRSYASAGGQSSRAENEWSSTSYGRRYLRLRGTLATSPVALGAC